MDKNIVKEVFGTDYFDAHFVSKVLLKQFCNAECKIKVFDKWTKTSSLQKMNSVGYIKLPKKYFQESEKTWKNAEDKLPLALAHIQEGSIFHERKSVDRLKNILALHYVRSISMYMMYDDHEKKGYQSLQIILQQHNHSEQDLQRKWIDLIYRRMPQKIADIKNTVFEFLKKHELEIAIAQKRKFILADTPVIVSRNDEIFGVLDGVGIKTCDRVFMPISPKYALSIRSSDVSKDRWIYLNSSRVSKLNRYTKQAAVQNHYCKP